jgi:hypothetical protein
MATPRYLSARRFPTFPKDCQPFPRIFDLLSRFQDDQIKIPTHLVVRQGSLQFATKPRSLSHSGRCETSTTECPSPRRAPADSSNGDREPPVSTRKWGGKLPSSDWRCRGVPELQRAERTLEIGLPQKATHRTALSGTLLILRCQRPPFPIVLPTPVVFEPAGRPNDPSRTILCAQRALAPAPCASCATVAADLRLLHSWPPALGQCAQCQPLD